MIMTIIKKKFQTVTVIYKVACVLPQRIENLQLFCVAHKWVFFVEKEGEKDYIMFIVVIL